MITYNSPKYNNLKENILKILEFNNIDIFDAEAIIPQDVLDTITLQVQECIISNDKFLMKKCPKCGKFHLKPFNSSYSRSVILKINNILIKVKIIVTRLICDNCGSTHVVLPDFCIPLKQYSKDAILEIVITATETSADSVADDLNIEVRQVRRFISLVKIFLPNLSLLIKELELLINFVDNSLKNLYALLEKIPNITEVYFNSFKIIFLYITKKRFLYFEYAKLSC